MKKQILTITSVALVAGALLFNGCKKDDVTAPVITLKGNSTVFSSLNVAYSDSGATATDDQDGSLTTKITVTGTVNKDLAGDYTLNYSVSDAAGNTGKATRTVTVRNDAYDWAGTYNVKDTCGTTLFFDYSQIVTASTTVNNRIHFNKFADYSNNSSIYATVNVGAGTVDLPSQTATGIGSLTESHTFSGTGTKTSTGFRLVYTDLNNTAGGAAASCKATFAK